VTSLLAHLAQRGLAREHDRRASSAKPGIIVGSLSTDNAADGHEESRRREKALFSLVCSATRFLMEKKMEIPESGTRAKHVLAQSTHNTVGACAVLEDSHRACV
jgi:hypothetical protein